ncbi:PP2C family serine/threonine-protein phosphatase [Emticicia sp. 17c]|uniref:PP2C family serine/threonine-protein phosphatase n=1 Tax=Emticicia sp. 17c TaxID=3127704 RepID=UPI00301B75DE
MSDFKTYIQALFHKSGIQVPSNKSIFFDKFLEDDENISLFTQIKETQQMLVDKWKIKARVDDIKMQPINIPNATAGKAYSVKLETEKWNWQDLTHIEFEGLTDVGLEYDRENKYITGTPFYSGDTKVRMRFRIEGEPEDSVLHEKIISFVVNPDPKFLWKNIESNQQDPYAKPDNVALMASLGDRNLVVASKRGRSHANNGSFRDDDFAFKHITGNGWSIVAVADGAGSSKLSRQGSRLACETTVNFFENQFSKTLIEEIDQFFVLEEATDIVIIPQELKVKIIQELYKITVAVHTNITDFAKKTETIVKDFHTTLIFCLFKKMPNGYLILSFGVGDCPIVLLNKEVSEVTLLNWLDVGEYGGGTRFITMPEIFSSNKMSSRFNVKFVNDFSFLFLMTDGIYDPKFVVEANLEKIEKWQEFLSDLSGNNEEEAKVEFKPDNKGIAYQLDTWLDFWSPGNHDDRTLAIIY